MDKLRQEIANLEAQEAEIEQSLNAAVTDKEEILIANDLKLVRNRLSEKREELRQLQEKEQSRAEVIEAKVQDEAIPFAVAGIDFTELPAEVITLIDEVVKADRRRMLKEHEIELEQLKHKLDAAIAGEKEANIRAAEWEVVATGYREEVGNLKLEVEDALAKRDAAVAEMEHFRAELDKANAEVERLNSQVEEYQRAKVFGEREAQRIIDVTPEENNSISAAVEAVKKLYAKVEDWGSVQKVIKPDGTFELTTRQQLAEEWAPIEPPEVPSFRYETVETDAVAPEVATSVEDTFHNPTAQHGDNQDADGSYVGVVSEEAESFEQEVRRRLEWLESEVDSLIMFRRGEAA